MTPFDDNLSNQESNNIFENHIFNSQENTNLPEHIEQNPQVNEVQDPLLRRVSNAYQVLAAAVIRANQAKRDLEIRIQETQAQIIHHQQRLAQVSEQIMGEQTEGLPQDEPSATQQIDTMNGCIREKHYHHLAARLDELSKADHTALPTIIDSMRAELDLIEIRAQRIRILESLRAAYSDHQYFQKYYQEADEEFRRLLNQH